MIHNTSSTIAITSLGWVDRGSFWVVDTTTGRLENLTVSQASYLSLHQGNNGFFAVGHHGDGGFVRITAHAFENPSRVLSTALIDGSSKRIDGDTSVWHNLPRSYVAYYKLPSRADFYLFTIDPEKEELRIHDLSSWYNDDYDKGYQGIVDVIDVPGTMLTIISVQRDSRPVIFDTETDKEVGRLSLADRRGNPTVYFRHNANEMWAIDYDTVLRLDEKYRVKDSLLLQPAEQGTAQFIGNFSFNYDESLCAVARPFSKDVVVIDVSEFKVVCRWESADQSLDVMLGPEGNIYSRDWKTGKFSNGPITKRRST